MHTKLKIIRCWKTNAEYFKTIQFIMWCKTPDGMLQVVLDQQPLVVWIVCREFQNRVEA
jgi:hypothetical protein